MFLLDLSGDYVVTKILSLIKNNKSLEDETNFLVELLQTNISREECSKLHEI